MKRRIRTRILPLVAAVLFLGTNATSLCAEVLIIQVRVQQTYYKLTLFHATLKDAGATKEIYLMITPPNGILPGQSTTFPGAKNLGGLNPTLGNALRTALQGDPSPATLLQNINASGLIRGVVPPPMPNVIPVENGVPNGPIRVWVNNMILSFDSPFALRQFLGEPNRGITLAPANVPFPDSAPEATFDPVVKPALDSLFANPADQSHCLVDKTVQPNNEAILVQRLKQTSPNHPLGYDVLWIPYSQTGPLGADVARRAFTKNANGQLSVDPIESDTYEQIRSIGLFPQDAINPGFVTNIDRGALAGFLGFTVDTNGNFNAGLPIDFYLKRAPAYRWQTRNNAQRLYRQPAAPPILPPAGSTTFLEFGSSDLFSKYPQATKSFNQDTAGNQDIVGDVWYPRTLDFQPNIKVNVRLTRVNAQGSIPPFYVQNCELTCNNLVELLRAGNTNPLAASTDISGTVLGKIPANQASAKELWTGQLWPIIDTCTSRFDKSGIVPADERLLAGWLFDGHVQNVKSLSTVIQTDPSLIDVSAFALFQRDELISYFLYRSCAWGEIHFREANTSWEQMQPNERWQKYREFMQTSFPTQPAISAALDRYQRARRLLAQEFPSDLVNPAEWPLTRITPSMASSLQSDLDPLCDKNLRIPTSLEWRTAGHAAWTGTPVIGSTWTGGKGQPWRVTALSRDPKEAIFDFLGNVSELVLVSNNYYKAGPSYRSELQPAQPLKALDQAIPIATYASAPDVGLRLVWNSNNADTNVAITPTSTTTNPQPLFHEIFGSQNLTPAGAQSTPRDVAEMRAVQKYFGDDRSWQAEYLRRWIWGTTGDQWGLRDELPVEQFLLNVKDILYHDVHAGELPLP